MLLCTRTQGLAVMSFIRCASVCVWRGQYLMHRRGRRGSVRPFAGGADARRGDIWAQGLNWRLDCGPSQRAASLQTLEAEHTLIKMYISAEHCLTRGYNCLARVLAVQRDSAHRTARAGFGAVTKERAKS